MSCSKRGFLELWNIYWLCRNNFSYQKALLALLMSILPHMQEENILDLYNNPEPVKPFLFYHTQTGTTSTFESVAFPGSFIASSKNGQPIFLTSEQGKYHNINFNLVLGP